MVRLNEKDLDKLILIGDKVLVRPSKPNQKTKSGLYLPEGMHKKEELHTGYIIKVGPGYAIPAMQDVDEPWKPSNKEAQYVPLQPKSGDLAVYQQGRVYEIMFNKNKYVIVPHSALLMLVRDDSIFE